MQAQTFEQFKVHLREALAHLHDPDYRPPSLLCAMIGCDAEGGAGPVQAHILHVISELQPSPDVRHYARARQDYDLLHHRFVLKLTQEETAERLHMSVRSVRRAQRVATHTLAQHLWEYGLARQVATGIEGVAVTQEQGSSRDETLPDWSSQVRQELSLLLAQAPGAVAQVGPTVARAIALEQVLGAQYRVSLEPGDIPKDLVAAVHPSFLRQILIMAIGQLIRYAPDSRIAFHAASIDDRIVLSLTTARVHNNDPLQVELIREMLESHKGKLVVETDDRGISLSIQVPSAGKVTVLVVDDNEDQVHFYRRCTVGTRYHIVRVPYGQRTVRGILDLDPDIVVLDILLPDVDGWELLADLQKHPVARVIPVIICSIIQEKDLAKALGAALYLPKPIHHRTFTGALAQALDLYSAEPTKD
jgi:CheY-like chemotaxis protein